MRTGVNIMNLCEATDCFFCLYSVNYVFSICNFFLCLNESVNESRYALLSLFPFAMPSFSMTNAWHM